jgi:hypothetical protein
MTSSTSGGTFGMSKRDMREGENFLQKPSESKAEKTVEKKAEKANVFSKHGRALHGNLT